jgi:hypothetical protein
MLQVDRDSSSIFYATEYDASIMPTVNNNSDNIGTKTGKETTAKLSTVQKYAMSGPPLTVRLFDQYNISSQHPREPILYHLPKFSIKIQSSLHHGPFAICIH